MNGAWERVEPLLTRVERPARYIDSEFGAIRQPNACVPRRAAVSRHLRDRAWRTRRIAHPLRPAERRRRGRPRSGSSCPGRHGRRDARRRRAAVHARERRAGARSRPPRHHAAVRADLHERAARCSTSRASRCVPRTAREADPLVIGGGPCVVQPRAGGRLLRRDPDRRGRGGGRSRSSRRIAARRPRALPRARRSRGLARRPRRLRAVALRASSATPTAYAGHAAAPGRARLRGAQARRRRPRRGSAAGLPRRAVHGRRARPLHASRCCEAARAAAASARPG